MLLSVLNVALVLPVEAISHSIILALPTKIFYKEVGFLNLFAAEEIYSAASVAECFLFLFNPRMLEVNPRMLEVNTYLIFFHCNYH